MQKYRVSVPSHLHVTVQADSASQAVDAAGLLAEELAQDRTTFSLTSESGAIIESTQLGLVDRPYEVGPAD